MAISLENLLRDARQAVKAGQAAQARRVLLQAFDRFPANPRIAAEMAPVQTLLSGLPARPFGPAHLQRGLRIRAERGLPEAIEDMVAWVILNPAHPAARNALGGFYIEAGYPAAALPHLDAAVKADPTFRVAVINRGAALLACARAAEAFAALAPIAGQNPDFGPAQDVLAKAAMASGHPEAAIAPLRVLVAQSPTDTDPVLRLGEALAGAGQDKAALDLLVAFDATVPGKSPVLIAIGNLLLAAGQMEQAEARFRAAIVANPKSGSAYYNLSRGLDFAPGDPALAGMQALADDNSLAPEDRVSLLFALSKAHEDLGETEQSFRRLEQANALQRSLIRYSVDQDASFMEMQARRHSPRTPALNLATLPKTPVRPIFVVGMMRSGTTLVEQILSAHPQVHGAGELDLLGASLAAETDGTDRPLDRAALMRVRNAYLGGVADLAKGRPVVVDKMPANFRFVGLIRLALPEARIIHLRRDPVAVCWSIYKTLFTSKAHAYAWDLGEVAAYYDLYEAFMARAAADWPGGIYDVDYRSLTETPEPVIRALLDHCDLPFDAACLHPEENLRTVRTASLRQVRKGIYTGSSSRWRGFEPYLAPLIAHFATRSGNPDAA